MSTHTTNAIVQTSKLVALGDAIRAKTGGSAEMTIDEMATAITNLPSGVVVSPLNVGANGTYNAPSGTAYSPVNVSVNSGAISGTFTTKSTAGTQQIDIPYTGNGYPVMVCISLDDAFADVPAVYGPWLFVIMVKTNPTITPTYSGSNDSNTGYMHGLQRTSSGYQTGGAGTSIITSYNRVYGGSVGAYLSQAIAVASSTKIKIYVNTSGSSGFMTSTQYRYTIAYSS